MSRQVSAIGMPISPPSASAAYSPVAKLVAFEEGKAPLFGYLAGSVTIHGDVVAPLNVDWDAEK